MARNTASTPTDTQRWAEFTRTPWQRANGAAVVREYDPRHEVAGIAGRIAGSLAVVLALFGGFAYLLVRVLAP